MRVDLAYGRGSLPLEAPDGADVLRLRHAPGCPPGSDEEKDALRAALRRPIGSPPLSALARAGQRVVIAHSDITRPTPNNRMLPVLLDELEAAGVRPEDITLLNALGTHRPQTEPELRAMLGERIVDRYQCLQHDAYDDSSLLSLPPTASGHPLRLNRRFFEADLKICAGFIEPHFFAGFSGGPKGVLPALAGAESVLTNHSRDMIGHPLATWGVTAGNPIWEEMREAALRVAPLFLFNVTLNAAHEITGVFAGDLLAAHAAGCAFVRQTAMLTVPAPYDIVVATNSGYPLDQNLYQTVKGMSAAARIVRPGGTVIMAAACQDGLPAHGRYAELLARAGSPQGVLDLLAQPGFSAQDQWQVQIQAQLQLQADVMVYSDGLTDEQIRQALFTPCRNLEAAIALLLNKYGPGARLAILPDGPQAIASVS